MFKYWGTLFGINFVLGIATGLTMEFEFGTNWAYYSHYIADIFGAPLAIEGMMALFVVGFYLLLKRKLPMQRWYLYAAFCSLPLPWIAAELGWVVAEYGRQPWIVHGILPTFMGSSSISVAQVLISLSGFFLFYTVLAIIEVYLMVKYIRLGPDGYLAK